MASSVSSSTSLLPKKRKLSSAAAAAASIMPPEIAGTEALHGATESSIDSTMALLIPSQRKASHDSSHLGSVQSEDAEALATLPSLGSFSSTTSRGFLKLPEVITQPSLPQPTLPQQHANLPKKRKIAVDDNASITPKELSFDQQSVATKTSVASHHPVEHASLPLLDTTSALDHLDALGDETAFIEAGLDKADGLLKDPPAPQHQQLPPLLPNLQLAGSDDNSSSTTLGSSNHRLLLEALKMSTNTSSHHNFNHAVGYGRDRLESWGGMSDLSVTGMGSDMGAALAASALQHTGIIDDITQAAAHFGGCADSVASSVSEEKPSATATATAAAAAAAAASVPSRISLGGRDRKWSVASLSEVSASGVPFLSDQADFSMHSTDVQAFVAAATLADQLSELAGAVEAAASSADSVTYQLMREAGITSDASSVASPLIGALNDNSSLSELEFKQRSRSSTVVSFSQQIAVDIDYEAVAAAVDAAEAVTVALDLTAIASIVPSTDDMTPDSNHSKSSKRQSSRRQLPLNKKRSNTLESLGSFVDPLVRMRSNTLESLGSFPDDLTCSVSIQLPPIPPIPSSTLSDRDLEAIRERARAAAGYVPPSGTAQEGATTPPPRPPFKKRAKRQSPEPDVTSSTPKLSNTTMSRLSESSELEVDQDIEEAAAAAAAAAADAKGPANIKWEEMYQTLLSFIDERRDEETKDLSESDKANWLWDGNVPTNFKTRDGKALGRWINNQRSAKAKGALKSDRENRLVNTGLRWSVLTSNSWNKMLEELKIYAEEQSKSGEPWDGNVPTNYVIPRGRATEFDEDKNLGRWVNRQRCLFQSGKLKNERKEALENMGLKWSMLATTSWDDMYESLCEYAKSKSLESQAWDGNVPANYRTNDRPPRSLGRWINRQRSAYTKNKLKKEYVDKLSTLGLRWAIHERKPLPMTVSPTSNGVPDAVKSDNGPEAPISNGVPDAVKSGNCDEEPPKEVAESDKG